MHGHFRVASSAIAAVAIGVAGPAPALAQEADAERQTLTVYTYDSFAADWGPGPQVEEAFEAQCDCDLQFVSVADGVALLNRLRLEGGRTDADVVLGLDTNLMAEARQTGYFAPHGLELGELDVPGGWNNDIFVPFDYGYFAVVYDTEAIADPPESMAQFLSLDSEHKIVIQDPRTSTPGLGLMLWIRYLYGEDAPQAYAELAERVLTVTPGWTESYGLFTGGEVPMVLSYTTSPAYHMIAEGTDRYQAMAFKEGHYMQIEVAAQTVQGSDNRLSQQFLAFMTGPQFQSIIPETNWMLPVAETAGPLDPAFDRLVDPERALLFDPETVAENRDAWVDEWLEAFSR
ncbi:MULTISPECIES: thiamine ABC transporter substrate binding subunit [unclassified Roseitalea]|uniref:thiamine ABC transporter substrate binding subunit n=1 Tax=unclassified Roseitalea TaxID=2639107 RepID=UPI00273D7D4F|nr:MULTISPECIES: thiamine ABC transporter substrate binding subunit [unclassified Roseitalea]